MRLATLLVTILMSVTLSLMLWLVNVVPFNAYTFTLHIVSIYIGAAGVLAYQRQKDKR